MHPADINAALIKSGRTQTRIADLLDVEQSLVSSVVHGRIRSRPTAAAIAAAIDKPIAEIWPGKYPRPASKRGRVSP